MPPPTLPLSLFTPSQVPSSFHCPSCLGVLDKPVVTCDSEGHLACAACVTPGTCAGCGGKIVEGGGGGEASAVGSSNKAVERAVGELTIKCKNGCEEDFKVAEVDKHDKTCPLLPLPCPNAPSGCTATLLGKPALRKHRRDPSGCPFQKVACLRSDKDPETGRYKCEFVRSQRGMHEEKCEWYRCDVDDCPTRGTSSLIATHQPHCQEVHLTASCVDDLETATERLGSIVDEKEYELEAVRTELEDLQDELYGAEEEAMDLSLVNDELEASIKEKDEELETLKTTLGEVQSTSCAKDSKVVELEKALKREKKRKEVLEKKVEEIMEGLEQDGDALKFKAKVKAQPKLKPLRIKAKVKREEDVKIEDEDGRVEKVMKENPAAVSFATTSGSRRNSSDTLVASSSSSRSIVAQAAAHLIRAIPPANLNAPSALFPRPFGVIGGSFSQAGPAPRTGLFVNVPNPHPLPVASGSESLPQPAYSSTSSSQRSASPPPFSAFDSPAVASTSTANDNIGKKRPRKVVASYSSSSASSSSEDEHEQVTEKEQKGQKGDISERIEAMKKRASEIMEEVQAGGGGQEEEAASAGAESGDESSDDEPLAKKLRIDV